MKIYTKIFIALFVSLASVSCTDWLDIDQEGEIEEEKLFASGDGYRLVLNGLYQAMGSSELYGNNLSFGMLDCMSQQYDWTLGANESSIYTSFVNYEYNDNNVKPMIDGIWLAGFKVIADANNLIQRAKIASNDLFEFGELERSLILGEAYACRALVHFDLLRLFAPAPVNDDNDTYVPYVKEYPNIYASSIKVQPFLENVIKDLLDAKNLVAAYDTIEIGKQMSASAAKRTSLSPSTNFQYGDFFAGRGYRLSYYSITALLSRVYQYAGKQKEAFDCAQEVLAYGLDGGAAFYLDDFNGLMAGGDGSSVDVFAQKSDFKLKSSLIFAAYNKKGYDYWRVGTFFNPEGGSVGAYYFPLKKLEFFKNRGVDEWREDYRSKYMLYSPNKKSFFISAKWFANTVDPMSSEHLRISPIIRATEMQYIIAEYYARINQFSEAYTILNNIRKARGLKNDLAIQNDWSGFLEDLIGDARREWISEGQLFYLYKRLDAEFLLNGKKHKLAKSEACLPLPSNQK